MRFSLMLFALALLLRVGGGQGGVKWLRKLANRCLRAIASRAWACGACGAKTTQNPGAEVHNEPRKTRSYRRT